LLLGDVSLLHDLTSLQLARSSKISLVIVVIQNHGGRIFEQLPLAAVRDLEPDVMRLTTTPQAIDLSFAAKLFDVRWERTTRADELSAALERAHKAPGCTLIEAVVGEHSSAEQSRRLWKAMDEKIAAEFSGVHE
jgi:2-succinyl-5-enolpyruvyl-6-hydroxy-3-cyclohexene-1-carboxylate synthase